MHAPPVSPTNNPYHPHTPTHPPHTHIAHMQNKPDQIRVGVELDASRVDVGSSQKGKLDGTHGGERYFDGKPKHCVLVLPKKVRLIDDDSSSRTAKDKKLKRRSSLTKTETQDAENIKTAAVLAETSKRKGVPPKETPATGTDSWC